MSAQGVRNLQGQRRRKEKGGGKRRQRCVLQKELPSTFTRVYFISVACASGVTSSSSSSCSSGSYAFVLPFLSRRGRKLARRVHTHPRQKSYVLYMRPLPKRINNNFWCAKEKSLIDFTLIFSATLFLFPSLSLYSYKVFILILWRRTCLKVVKKRRKNSHNFHYCTWS